MPKNMPIDRLVPLVIAVFVAHLATQGLSAIAKHISNQQLGWLGLGCTIGFILCAESPWSAATTPPKMLLLTWWCWEMSASSWRAVRIKRRSRFFHSAEVALIKIA